MAKFRLTTPFVTQLGSDHVTTFFASGDVIDSAAMPASFRPHPLWIALDSDAVAMLESVVAGIRAGGGDRESLASVPSIGPLHDVFHIRREVPDEP
jgi:hypothetical protein